VSILGSDETPQIRMVCRANEQIDTTVYEDEPLILSVSLVNDAAIHASSFNAPYRDELLELERKLNAKQIAKEEYERMVKEIEGKMLKVKVIRFGGPQGWSNFIKFQIPSRDAWREVKWPLWLLVQNPPSQVADLDASTPCYVEFGLDPKDEKRPKGEFQVKAVAEIVKGKSTESNIVTVNLLEQEMPEPKRGKEETLLALGSYAYKRGLYENAVEYVQRTLQVNPSSTAALNMLGDIEERRGNFSAALSAYEKALEAFYVEFPKIREPPRPIEAKIIRLRALMKR